MTVGGADPQAQPQAGAATLGGAAARRRDGTPVLELRAVRAGYGQIEVLHGVDLSVAAGEVLALFGPNGAGKTTTLGVCSGQIRPSAGSVRLMGTEVSGARPHALARAGVCLIPEGRGIFPNLTVRENLRMATYSGVDYARVQERAFSQFPRLAERRTQLAGTLSGGEQQMLAISRGLATDPALLLLDELSMGLAPMIVAELYERVGEMAAAGLSILIVEQFAQSVLGVADRAAVMLGGRVQQVGDPSSIAAALGGAYLGDNRGRRDATTPAAEDTEPAWKPAIRKEKPT